MIAVFEAWEGKIGVDVDLKSHAHPHNQPQSPFSEPRATFELQPITSVNEMLELRLPLPPYIALMFSDEDRRPHFVSRSDVGKRGRLER